MNMTQRDFDLVAFSAGHAVKQVPFPAILLPCTPGVTGADGLAVGGTPCYVGADPGALGRALHSFMAITKPARAAPAPGAAGGACRHAHRVGRRGLERGAGLDVDGDRLCAGEILLRPQPSRDTLGEVSTRPQKLDGTLAFMFESRWTILPTAQAMNAGFRQRDYDAVWSGLSRKFR